MPDDEEEEESVVQPPAARALNRGSHDPSYPWAGNWLGCRTECANYVEKQGGGRWTCSVCTLLNDAGRQICRSCDNPAVGVAAAVAAAPAVAVASPEVAGTGARAAPAFVFQAPPTAAAPVVAAFGATAAFVFQAPPSAAASESTAAPAFVFQAPFAATSSPAQA
jgi:hypothetical protein